MWMIYPLGGHAKQPTCVVGFVQALSPTSKLCSPKPVLCQEGWLDLLPKFALDSQGFRYCLSLRASERCVLQDFYDSARERVFTAERAIMYALGFDFETKSVYGAMVDFIREGPVRKIR